MKAPQPPVILKRPLRTQMSFGDGPVLPPGTPISVTTERVTLPPGMLCTVIVSEGNMYSVFPAELEWATKD